MSEEITLQENETIERTIEVSIERNGLGIDSGQVFPSVRVDFAPIVVPLVLPDYSLFGGIVSSDEPIPHGDDHRYCYIATQQGRYHYFGDIVLNGDFACLLFWEESQNRWAVNTLYITGNGLSEELQNYVRKQDFYVDMGFPYFSQFDSFDKGDYAVYKCDLYKFNAAHHGIWTGNDVEKKNLYSILRSGL